MGRLVGEGHASGCPFGPAVIEWKRPSVGLHQGRGPGRVDRPGRLSIAQDRPSWQERSRGGRFVMKAKIDPEALTKFGAKEPKPLKPRWPGLTFEAVVKTIDDFCLRLPGERGDRIRAEYQGGREGASWTFTLDGVELGRLIVSPLPGGGFTWTEQATALLRGATEAGVKRIPQIERERHDLFAAILADLEYALDLAAGVRKPAGRLERLMRYFRQPAANSSDGLTQIEREFVTVYEQLTQEGIYTDDLAAARLAMRGVWNRRGESFSRHQIYRLKNRLRDRGIIK